MSNEIVKYNFEKGRNYSHNLDDLSGTFDDIGQLLSYMRDLTRQMVPLVDSLVPLSDNLNEVLEDFPSRLERFLDNNPLFLCGGIAGLVLVFGYLGTGIIKNIFLLY